ncbi:MAG: RNA-protein complex protein Nop10 [Crenarchaeota archaeon]|nr:RNA-protein complex protein Nop10 [Thermoproteota archaeon]
MQAILRKCKRCGRYTLRKDRCPYCGGEVVNPHPPKYSPDDRYFIYRLLTKIVSGEIKLPEDVKNRLIEKIYGRTQQVIEASSQTSESSKSS